MIVPAKLPLDRLKRVLARLHADPGLSPADLGESPSARRTRLERLEQGGQGGALGLVGGEPGVEGRVLSLQ